MKRPLGIGHYIADEFFNVTEVDVYDASGHLDPEKVMVWAIEWEKNKIAKVTQVGPLRVSTVFLGLDHRLSFSDEDADDYQPIVFETMVFNDGNPKVGTMPSFDEDKPPTTYRYSPALEERTNRHATFAEAVAYHLECAARLAPEWGEPMDSTEEARARWAAHTVAALFAARGTVTFTCPTCGAVSYNPSDHEHNYCGKCHAFQ